MSTWQKNRSIGTRLTPVRRAFWRVWYGHWLLTVLYIYLATRVLTTVIMILAATHQPQTLWISNNPDYFNFANIWDARWYRQVVYFGYPSRLPIDSWGSVEQNTWAFMPGYPIAVKFLMLATGIPFNESAVLVSLVFGWAACAMLYKLSRAVGLSRNKAMFAVVLLGVSPFSPMFQVGYAESMNFFFLALGLYLMKKRRWGFLLLVLPVIAFTRPLILAFALGLGFVFIRRVYRRVKAREYLSNKETGMIIANGVFAAVLGLSWPVIAAIATGKADAYILTELAWRGLYGVQEKLIPFSPWPQAFVVYSNYLNLPNIWGIAFMLALVGLLVYLVINRFVRRLGFEIYSFALAYVLYILATFFPQTSSFRLLMPLATSLGAITLVRVRWVKWVFLFGFVVAQVAWVNVFWILGPNDVTPP